MMVIRVNPNFPLTLCCIPTCDQDLMETMVSLERAVDALEREVNFKVESFELWVLLTAHSSVGRIPALSPHSAVVQSTPKPGSNS